MTIEQPSNRALLPRLRVQNANAISSPMTWGFPAITAFTGLMTALARRLRPEDGIAFYGVGVICHGFEPQVTQGAYTRSFHLTRNPVLKDGGTASIVEEGRVHLDISLVFGVELTSSLRAQLAARIDELVAGMRIAGGSVMPPLSGARSRRSRPQLTLVSDDQEASRKDFRALTRRCLPGFALVSREDLLQSRLTEMRLAAPDASLLDAWLDLSRLNYRAVRQHKRDQMDAQIGRQTDDDSAETTEWIADTRAGWTVPIPVGFAALSPLHAPGVVAGARDPNVPFRFVESVYSIGQWISPHRLTDIQDLLWVTQADPETGLYRCVNDFHVRSSSVSSL